MRASKWENVLTKVVHQKSHNHQMFIAYDYVRPPCETIVSGENSFYPENWFFSVAEENE